MSSSKESSTPLLEEIDDPIVVAIINQVAESLDGVELSVEAALLLAVVIDCVMNALWLQYPHELLLVYSRAIMATDEGNDDDDEPEPNGSDDSGQSH